ncbi:PGF-CTERM sorting domain-containing protein [Haloferax sp. Atlit-6N]|uniref:PGF-CTERM sorting domain-containing protein n=1 Tax=Haloferax sp. Atlit-6N TaxID=2077205 RepID=UPI0018F3FF85|nr:PGF-CTERM sorting domain-containing protein [Haloferax sp. Atlit-6N]
MRPSIPRPGRSTELRNALPVVAMAVLLVLGSLGLGAAIAPVAADAHGGTLTRTVDDTTLAPGESTTVTVEVNASERGNFTVVEELSPGFESVEIVDADGADFSGVRNADDELFATYGDRESVTLVYEVTAADDANATTHELTGYGDFGLEDIRASTTGDGEINVSTDDGASVVRSVDDATLAPGESATVWVAVERDEAANFTLVEEFSPAFGSVEIVDADGADFSGVRDANDELFATYGDRKLATLVYEVTATDDATTGTVYELDGFSDANGSQSATDGTSELSVQESSDDDLAAVRSVDDATLAPGESTTVRVAFDRDRATNFTLVEEFSPAFGSVEIVDADGADFSAVRDANDELFATYGDRELATLVYEVTADNDATASTVYEFDGFSDVNGSQSATGGSGEISVQASDGDDSGAVRSVDDETLAPGESTTVTVEVDRDEAANFTLIEEFNPAFASVEIVDDDGADFSGVRNANDELFATYGDRESVTLQYRVTAGDDVDAGTAYQFDGFTDVDGSEVTTGGTDELDVQSESDDDNWDLTRSADDTTLEPGESTVVSVEITGSEATNFTVIEEFNPGFASVEIVDDDGADFSGVRNANDELFATYGDRENVTLQYRVTAGEDMDEDASYELSGFAQFDADDKEMSVDGLESLSVGADGDSGDDGSSDDGSDDGDDGDDSNDGDGGDDNDGDDDGDDNDGDDGDDGDDNDGDDGDDGDGGDDNDGGDGDDNDGDDSDDGTTETTTADPNTPATTTTDTPVPGFGVSVALAALVMGSVLLARRRTT